MSEQRKYKEGPATTSTNMALVKVEFAPPPQRKLWGAYGVVDEDGALSWNTYPDVESAKSDCLYRGKARIVRLRMQDVGTEVQRELTFAETLRDKPDAERVVERFEQPDTDTIAGEGR